MNKAKLSLIGILIIAIFSSATLTAYAELQNYPNDGKFKQISSSKNSWYFIDYNNWYIQAPDKSQHTMDWNSGTIILNFSISLH